MYTKQVIKHFKNPKNMGKFKKPDGVAEVGNPKCGDVMKMYVKIGIRDKGLGLREEYIKDIKFQTLGCPAAIATSSVATQLVKGKSLSQALKLTNKKIADNLGGLPKIKLHCSVLAIQALHKAIRDYQSKTKKADNK